MATIRHDSKELQFNIVYFGASGSGRSSNLQYIHRRLDPHLRSDLLFESDRGDCAFDYLPVHASYLPEYRTRFRLQEFDDRRTLLDMIALADGIVFVSDSKPTRIEESVKAHHGLRRTIDAEKISMPLVYQYNKRDLRSAVRPEILDEVYGVSSPSFLSCALSGSQVFATLDHLAEKVTARFMGSEICHSAVENADMAVGSA